MAKKSSGSQVRNGRAFEYALAKQYYAYVADMGLSVRVEENASLATAEAYYGDVTAEARLRFDCAARNTIASLVKIEPGLTNQQSKDDVLSIALNSDQVGEHGDVRDVVFSREKSGWEIGFSAKNNNDAIKHNRLSRTGDWGQSWLGVACSEEYFNDIKEPFDYIGTCIERKMEWNEVKGKQESVYVPLLAAFRKEMLRIARTERNIPSKLIEYLIGNYPFYKIIKDDDHNLVVVKAFNMRGQLNKSYNGVKPICKTPRIGLPKRIVEFEMKAGSKTTLEMILDNGWAVSFRIHSADGLVVSSLKFDIKLLGNPPVLFSQYIFQEP